VVHRDPDRDPDPDPDPDRDPDHDHDHDPDPDPDHDHDHDPDPDPDPDHDRDRDRDRDHDPDALSCPSDIGGTVAESRSRAAYRWCPWSSHQSAAISTSVALCAGAGSVTPFRARAGAATTAPPAS
jgi:hypothetical protein